MQPPSNAMNVPPRRFYLILIKHLLAKTKAIGGIGRHVLFMAL